MLDPLGKLLIEIRDDATVDAIVDGRVRGFEPAPGDAKGAGHYQPFVVIVALGGNRWDRMPTRRATYAVRCYGIDPVGAMALYGACSDAIHHIGPRLYANGQGIYISRENTGGNASKDPDTAQPYVDFVIELLAATQAVAV